MPEDTNASDRLYNEMAELKTPVSLGVDAGIEDVFNDSLSDRMKTSPKMSDTQVVDKRLFPVLKETIDWLNNMMVARVFPETLNPLRNIITKHLLQEYPDMSMAEAICLAEVALTVAIDGEGRMDIIHLFSKLSEATPEEKGKI